MYALFTALPYIGHLNPLLRQAQALQRRGWRVALTTTGEMAAHVNAEAPGVPFLDLGALGELVPKLRQLEGAASGDRNYVAGALTLAKALASISSVMFYGLRAALGG